MKKVPCLDYLTKLLMESQRALVKVQEKVANLVPLSGYQKVQQTVPLMAESLENL